MNVRHLALFLGLLPLAACGKETPPPAPPDPMAECRRVLTNIMVAVQRYDDDNGGYPASGFENLVEALKQKGFNGEPFYPFDEGTKDPWGNPWRYVNNVDGSAPSGWNRFEPYAAYSTGPNGRDEQGEGDDVASWNLN